TRCYRDWSSDVCSSDLARVGHLLDGQRRDAARFAVARGQRAEVDVRQRVAGDDQERLVAEELGALAHAAGRAEQLLLEAVGDARSEERRVGKGWGSGGG